MMNAASDQRDLALEVLRAEHGDCLLLTYGRNLSSSMAVRPACTTPRSSHGFRS